MGVLPLSTFTSAVVVVSAAATETLPGGNILNTTVCAGRCDSDCVTYETPLGECFNSGALFPDDPTWSGSDVYDEIIVDGGVSGEKGTLRRTVFISSFDGSCTPSSGGEDDRFRIDLGVCVGPFGRPRPWGVFSVIPDSWRHDQARRVEEMEYIATHS